MKRHACRHRLLYILLPLVLFIAGCPGPQPVPVDTAPPVEDIGPATVITVMGQPFHLTPGSGSDLLVQVWNNSQRRAAAGTRVQVTLSTPNGNQQLFSGITDAEGLVLAGFDIPQTAAEGQATLTVSAGTGTGEARYVEQVYVGQTYNVLLSTDKPVYQPGQVIHVRGLALDSLALQAAQAQPLLLTIDDPQGNRLTRREIATSRWGVAAMDFALDSQAPSGDYVITAQIGPDAAGRRSQRTVEVKPYQLPRFKIEFNPARSFYLPGDTAQGTVAAHYFFGKPVAGGSVHIEGFITDVERQKLFDLTGETGADGIYAYEFTVPDHLVGQLENNTTQIDLEITVTDTADHPETVSEGVTVAEQPLLVEAVAESGSLRPGLENILYLQTSYPDGRSVQADLTVQIDGVTHSVQTDEFGLATLTVTPSAGHEVVLDVQARALDEGEDAGPTVETRLALGAFAADQAVLLRPQKARYQVGETLSVDILVAGMAQTAYLDVVKDGQTFGLVAVPVQRTGTDGSVAQAAIDLDGSLLGTLELHAYVITDRGEIVRDRRYVLVEPTPAQIEVSADKETYRPGDTANLDVQVRRDGAAMPSVLGVSIVDESVFSVGAQEPGFARTYFLLERELSEPRFEIHDFVPLQAGDPSPYDGDRKPMRSTGTTIGTDVDEETQGAGESGDAQQLALFGFFAEELALIDGAPIPVGATAQAGTAGDRAALALTWGSRVVLALPLLGVAFWVPCGRRSRRRRHALIALLLLTTATFVWGACAAPAAPAAVPAAGEAAMEAPAAEEAAEGLTETTATRGSGPRETRLRQFFPETLFWIPEAETDDSGHARLEVPIADSITTWRVSILASDEDGNLGSVQTDLRVFQDFFIEPDLPRFLTVGDEISMPVSIFNYLDRPQTVNLAVDAGDWFEFVQDQEVTVAIAADEVAAVYLPIRVTGHGVHHLTVRASGDAMGDAVQREVAVLPDGAPFQTAINGMLEQESQAVVTVPEAAIPGTARVVVKLYPGVVSQVVAGLEGLLQQPFGCFEQTSSTTYPNVLVLDYLKTTGQINPRVQLQAEEYINLGYQRLLTFETNVPGGFSLFGEPPPWTMLTAYGLMEFTDMSKVSYVDPALIERTVAFLFAQQRGDGSWGTDGMTVESGWERLGNADLPVTAYIAWSLADAGYAGSEPVQRAIAYVKAELARLQGKAPATFTSSPLPTPQVQVSLDPYALAIVANALIAADPADPMAKELLADLVARAEGTLAGAEDGIYWRSDLPTYMGGQGTVASIETTAMIAIALLRSHQHPEVAQAVLDYLVGQRDSFGTFYTTQATILALKALLLGTQSEAATGTATISVSLNGGRTQQVTIDDGNRDVVQQIVFDDIAAGEQIVALTQASSGHGNRRLQYQVIVESYQPWSTAGDEAPAQEQDLQVDLFYDRTDLIVNDVVDVTALVELMAPGTAGTILVDLGVPPGFSPLTEDLEALVAQGTIDRYELTGRQILVYLTDVPSGRIIRLDYRLQARYPIRAQTPASRAYDYYTPDRQDVASPKRITVRLGTP